MKTSGLAKWGEGIPSKLRLFLDALKRFDEDHCFLLSSGIAFAILLSLIPLLLLVLALIGTYLFSDQEVLNHISEYLKDMFPSLDPEIKKNILKIVQDRRIVGILGMGGLLWTSTWVFSSLSSALNIIFRVEKDRSLLRGKAVDLFLLLLAGTLLLMSMALSSVITLFQGYPFRSLLDIGFIGWLKYTIQIHDPLFGRIPQTRYSKNPKNFVSLFSGHNMRRLCTHSSTQLLPQIGPVAHHM